MRYNAETKLLTGEGGARWIKRLDCPLNKKWHELQRLTPGTQDGFTAVSEDPSHEGTELKRHCPSCRKDVINVTDFDDRQVGALLRVDPTVCVYASRQSKYISFEGVDANRSLYGPSYSCWQNTVGVPIVNTARTVYAINAAAKEGYWPLLRPVVPSDRIKQKILVSQNDDGTIDTHGDFRSGYSEPYWYNPYRSPLPFAAYLIPPGLQAGTRVYLPDLIEDIEGSRWNQGDTYRRQSGYAIWDGKELIVEQDEPLGFVG
jgi:hypothetical protein